MSVYFINANDEDDTVDEVEVAMTVSTVSQTQSEAHAALAVFWPKVSEEINKIKMMDLKVQALPLARIKKIMKLDEDVKMISAEAPVLFAKAAEIFIHELTLRAWVHTEDNKRRTLQRNDIAMAIAKYDQFDFLIDIVPRDEVKAATSTVSSVSAATSVKTESGNAVTAAKSNQEQVQYYLQLAQQHNQVLQGSNSDTSANQNVSAAPTTAGHVIQVPTQAAQQPGNIQIVHQIVTPSGEVQNIPIQLNQSQLQVIRMQMQSATNQPVIVQSVAGQQGGGNPIIQLQTHQ